MQQVKVARLVHLSAQSSEEQVYDHTGNELRFRRTVVAKTRTPFKLQYLTPGAYYILNILVDFMAPSMALRTTYKSDHKASGLSKQTRHTLPMIEPPRTTAYLVTSPPIDLQVNGPTAYANSTSFDDRPSMFQQGVGG